MNKDIDELKTQLAELNSEVEKLIENLGDDASDDEIKEIDGRPFAGVLIHPFGFVNVPVDVGSASGNDLLAVDLMEALQKCLGLG